MVSLETDNRVIVLNKLGWWTIGAYIQLASTGCNPGYASLDVSLDSGDFVVDAHDGIVGFLGGTVETIVNVTYSTTGFPKVSSTASFSGTNCSSIMTTQRVRMWAFWMRDL
jgi:hypothetical protein